MKKSDELCTLWNNEQEVKARNVKINELHEFKNHPFRVEQDMNLLELSRSIQENGVLVPLIVRPNPNGEGFEIIAGHRRKAACEWAGVDSVPVIVMQMEDAEAIIAMVDSNLQREHIRPSEKAFAYRMRMEAVKQQGKRTDLAISPLDKKSNGSSTDPMQSRAENTTAILYPLAVGYTEKGEWKVIQTGDKIEKAPIRNNELLARQMGESIAQIARYIRLTYLVPKILDMVVKILNEL